MKEKYYLTPNDKSFLSNIVGIILLVLISFLSFQYISSKIQESFITKEKEISNLISISANQRLHSQRIGLLAYLYITTKNPEIKSKIGTSLKTELEEMKSTQEDLVHEKFVTWKEIGYSEEVNQILYRQPHVLHAKVQKFLKLSEKFLSSETDNAQTATQLTDLSSQLLEGFGLLTEQFRKEGISGVDELSKNTTRIIISETILVIAIILISLLFIIKRLIHELNVKNENQNVLEQKNDELSGFSSIIAHDLKAPLANLIGFSSILKDGLVNESDKNNIIERINDCASRMSSMITDLLMYSKIIGTKEEYEEFPLDAVIENIKKNIGIESLSADSAIDYANLRTLRASKVKCEHLFQNLMSNAIKYRDRSKGVKILISDLGSTDDNVVRIAFEDNGPGFPEGLEETIFEPFKRLDNDANIEGTGLGLTLCKKIVEQHGGSIVARKSYNLGGACIEIILPKAIH